MNRLLIRLWGVLEDEDQESINYQIASTLVKNIASIKHTSSAALAEFCNVSKPSISRFCKNLGYEDFYDFRAELNQYCPDRGLKYQLPKRGDRSQWMEGYFSEIGKKLALLQAEEVQKGIESLVQDIHDYQQVYLVGNMQSGSTASNLHYNLHVAKKNLFAVSGLKEQKQVLEKRSPDKLLVIFSVSGEYFRALFPSGEIPKQAPGSKTWMVTTNPAIHKMEGVDAVLNCKTGSNLAGSNICLEMAANLIAYCYWNLYQ